MTHDCLAMMESGYCKVVSAVAAQPRKPAVNISKAVGKNATNLAVDVKAIQNALNDVGPSAGGPSPKLVVDGLCYAKTLAAIHKFQGTFMKWPDDRIDPGGATLSRLNAVRGSSNNNGSGSGPLSLLGDSGGEGTPEALLPNPYIVPLVLSLLPDVRRCLKAAEAEFLQAMPFVGLSASTPQREARMQRVNLHFAIDSHPRPGVTFNETYTIFRRASLAIARHHSGPDAAGVGIFEANRIGDMEKKARGYAFAGGYRQVGNVDPLMKIRTDLVYICSKMARYTRDFQVMGIVHELAHFVGETGVNRITDYGYGWIDDRRMKRLVPWQRTHTAQSYANFAFQCAFNRSPFGPGDMIEAKDK